MENRDSDPAAPGVDLAAFGFAVAARNLQIFAEEIGRISRLSFAQNAKLIEDLSGARDIGDVVAVQTKFMTGMFETFNEQVRLMMSRLADQAGGVTGFAANLAEAGIDGARPPNNTAASADQASAPETAFSAPEPPAGADDVPTHEGASPVAPTTDSAPQVRETEDAPLREAVAAALPPKDYAPKPPYGAAEPDGFAAPVSDSTPSLRESDEAPLSEAVADLDQPPIHPEPPVSENESPAPEPTDERQASEADSLQVPLDGAAGEQTAYLDAEFASDPDGVDWQAPMNEALEIAYRTLEVAVSSMQSGLETSVHVAQVGIDEAKQPAEDPAGSEPIEQSEPPEQSAEG